jgi:hypothetical protein
LAPVNFVAREPSDKPVGGQAVVADVLGLPKRAAIEDGSNTLPVPALEGTREDYLAASRSLRSTDPNQMVSILDLLTEIGAHHHPRPSTPEEEAKWRGMCAAYEAVRVVPVGGPAPVQCVCGCDIGPHESYVQCGTCDVRVHRLNCAAASGTLLFGACITMYHCSDCAPRAYEDAVSDFEEGLRPAPDGGVLAAMASVGLPLPRPPDLDALTSEAVLHMAGGGGRGAPAVVDAAMKVRHRSSPKTLEI